jgi:type IV pilus assembly protein PilV
MLSHPQPLRAQLGTTLIEVLVTLVILAVGLLGIAALQTKTQMGSLDSYQRAQAVILLGDMVNRINGNPTQAAAYVDEVIGTGDDRPDSCADEAAGAELDLCEWSRALRGAAETTGSNATKIGGMSFGRGCVKVIQAADPTPGVCRPGIYRISVAWQGMHETVAPSVECGKDTATYGPDTYRRVVSQNVTIGLPTCQ